MNHFSIAGNIVNILKKQIVVGTVHVADGRIRHIEVTGGQVDPDLPYLLPGFIDSHVHIESSMLVPSAFARLAVVHGTVATISDPHEIANVCGVDGVEYMIENGKQVPFKFFFGAPSCVPATSFETAGAVVDAAAVKELLQRPEIKYLSEMMNFPGVLNGEEEVMLKLQAAHAEGKPVDGHAPGLRGDAVRQYINAGISTDHECFTREEAFEKLQYGMKILIREGSAAQNFEALIELLQQYPDHMMFCSDDKHPDSLVEGHINQLCARAVAKGIDVFHVLQAACVNPVLHYNLEVGLLQEGDPADFIMVNNLQEFRPLKTWINGRLVAENGESRIEKTEVPVINHFGCSPKTEADLAFHHLKFGETDAENIEQVYVIEALDGQLITRKHIEPLSSFAVKDGRIYANPEADLLYMVVVNRYHDAPVAKCFVKNFGLKKGAIASSVAHDSHNIIAVGADTASLCRAVNLVIGARGGISAVGDAELLLPLPVGGLMSADDGYEVAKAYSTLDAYSKQLGSRLRAPFMTLSFMALLVIPHLKLSDLGLFDGDAFRLV
ncbi:MAG: adenine deaminase [Lacibacter sp.]